MAEAFDTYKFLWWRFSEYELKDGYIRPAPGAELQSYDPWKAYRESWEYDPDSATPYVQKRQQGPPYLSLLALVEDLKLTPDSFNLDNKRSERLLEWCSEFGLLGMLPQRVHMVALMPRWLPESPWGAILGHKLERGKDRTLYPTQFIYCRYNASLLQFVHNEESINLQGWSPTQFSGDKKGQAGKRLGEIYTNSLGMKPGVLIQNMGFVTDDGVPTVMIEPFFLQESFGQSWSTFFPSIPRKQVETYLYPIPLSPPFWEIYSESVSDFLMGVYALRDALVSLNESASQFDDQQFWHGHTLLNNLVSSASMVITRASDGSYRQEWRAASLLGCFAMMALQDLTQQRKVMRCENCNRLFVTEAYQARYCSERCRHTAQKRRYRQKLKEGQNNG